VKVCPPSCGKSRPCIPKCCKYDQIYSAGVKGGKGKRGCQSIPGPLYFNPPLYSDFHQKAPTPPLPHFYQWTPKDFKFNCYRNKTTFFPGSEYVARNMSLQLKLNTTLNPLNFRIRKDGAFLYRNLAEKKCSVEEKPEKVLCFDGIQDFGGYEIDSNAIGFQNTEEEYIIHLCTGWNVQDIDSQVSESFFF